MLGGGVPTLSSHLSVLAAKHMHVAAERPLACMMRSIFCPSPGGRKVSMNMRSAASKSMPAEGDQRKRYT